MNDSTPPSTPRRSLALRLSLLLLAPIVLCLAAYGYGVLRLRRTEMLDEAAREVRDHGTVLEVALDAILRDRRLVDLNEITEDLSRADRVLGVLVFDAGARPVQSSRSVLALQPRYTHLARQALLRRAAVSELNILGGRPLFAYAFPVGDQPAEATRGAAVLIRDLGYIDEILARSKRNLALLGVALALAVSLVVSLALRAAVLRPVATLVSAAERVGAGALDAAVPVETRDEMGRLARAFNRMVSSLRAARHALDAQNEATLALERRLRHAQRLALVGQMAANVAHQVGSPLNVVLGRARYALRQGALGERETRHFQEIVVGAEQISRVIEQLLSHARKVRGAAVHFDLAGLARDTLRFLEVECERRGVRASLRTSAPVPMRGSRDEFEQVLLNLCINALQAQPKGGQLIVEVSADAEHTSLVVDDAGPGVPEAIRAQIFTPFFTTKDAGEGTGLGLAICEELVHQQGGTIRVEASPIGGARFCVTLPPAERR